MEHQWLEELENPRSLEWVERQSQTALRALQAYPKFEDFYREALVFNSSSARLPCHAIEGDWVYDLLSSADRPLGVWRRCRREEFPKDDPQWRALLDLDALARAGGEEWQFNGAELAPSGRRALVSLSLRGGDAHQVREFDLEDGAFVSGGFEIPLSKSTFSWVDENTILVGGEEPETTNDLGYPRRLRLWRRGGGGKDALMEGAAKEFGCYASAPSLRTGRITLGRHLDWDHAEYFEFEPGGELRRWHLPLVAQHPFDFEDKIIFYLPQDLPPFRAGSVLSARREDALKNANPALEAVWTPDERRAGEGVFRLGNGFVVSFRENIVLKFAHVRSEGDGWLIEDARLPENVEVAEMMDDRRTDRLFLKLESFTSPPMLVEWRPDGIIPLRSAPAQFEGEYETLQDRAVSRDGTKIPYYVVRKKGLQGPQPTLLYGYGGFQHALPPAYAPAVGKLWLERGGVYVVANIRGGGEFGPRWHLSARKENKQRSYDDFIAVAERLIAQGLTRSENLAISGRSNGGLLVGAVAMQRPDLFGAVLCGVPLLDMIRYVELPPGASWMEEYGDPRDDKMKRVILAYSPYQNVRAERTYPKIFFFTSRMDDRVHPGHARKMAAKLQALGKDCFFYEEATGGHKGGSVPVKALNHALQYSYLWSHVGGGFS